MKNKAIEGDLLFADNHEIDFGQTFIKNIYEKSNLRLKRSKNIGDIQLLDPVDHEGLANTPLYQHCCITPTQDHFKMIEKAIHLLKKDHSVYWSYLSPLLRGLLVVELNPKYEKQESLITSISLPGLPYISIISEKAFIHAPPSLVLENPSFEILAENLIHEATHQWVNLNIIDNDILRDEYDSETSPKIEIPWRSKVFYPRDKNWPIDRCIHAATVYFVISKFRLRQMKTSTIYTHGLFEEAKNNGIFLSREILKNKNVLTEFGENAVLQLLKDLENVENQ